TQVQRGNVVTRTKAENLARVKNYFSSFKFIEWENLKPPVVKISKDGTMATIIVQKRVRGTYKNDKGEEILDQTDFAWLEVWEKIDGKWKVVTVASTEKMIENKK
ncbi:MAG TPA: nuclear transport factor 2 family protein, partial [Pyrinomonadaceae bacterium]|nr:nuclear transport factor 2 family protein [Pyrinomonadaceae bacterium]